MVAAGGRSAGASAGRFEIDDLFGQPERECGALGVLALDGDFAAHYFLKLPREGHRGISDCTPREAAGGGIPGPGPPPALNREALDVLS